jgi:hypothetical protein
MRQSELSSEKGGSRNQHNLLCRSSLAIKTLDEKLVLTEKRAIFGAFWQLNRCFGKEKTSLLSCFGGFLRFSASQAVAGQHLTSAPTLQKKSYQKAYGRFFVFWESA